MPATLLTSTAAAGAISLTNPLGNRGGIVGAAMLGWVKDTTNSLSGGFTFQAF